MIKKYFSLFALLSITAMGTGAEIVESGTLGTVLYTLDNEGTMSVSGSGEIILNGKVDIYWDWAPNVKKIVFAEDCTISKIGNHVFSYNSFDKPNTPLTDIEINTTVPLEIGTEAFVYQQSSPVNITVTAPSVTAVGTNPFSNNGTGARNIVFNVGEPITFEYNSFSNLTAADNVTIPAGSFCHLPAYLFNDPTVQDYYNRFVKDFGESVFWSLNSTYQEGTDYTKIEVRTVELTPENTNLVFGGAKVNFKTFHLSLTASDDSKGKVIPARRIVDTNLFPGCIIQEGDIVTFSYWNLWTDQFRLKRNGVIDMYSYIMSNCTIIFGLNGFWTNPEDEICSPVTKSGEDGNAWKVSSTSTIINNRMYVCGIQLQDENVQLPDGVTRNADGSYNVKPGTHLTVIAMANEDYHITGWSNGDTPIEGATYSNYAHKSPDLWPTISVLDITVDSDMDLKVNFAKNAFDINFTALNAYTIEDGKATVTVNDTPATLTNGTLKDVKPGSTVKISASEGYKIAVNTHELDAAFQKDAMVTVNYKYGATDAYNSSTFISNGDNTFSFASGSGYAGGDKIRPKELFVQDGNLVFWQHFTDLESTSNLDLFIIFNLTDNTYSIQADQQAILNLRVDFTSISINGTDITNRLKKEVEDIYKTEKSFTMPVHAMNVSYELVRDLTVGTTLNMVIDNEPVTADTHLVIKQDDTYGYVPREPLAISLTDNIENVTLTPQQVIAAGITPIYYLKDGDNWTPANSNPTTNLPADIAPGQTYRVTLKANNGSTYIGETARSYALTLFDGYKVDVPAGAYITYYKDEALCVDDDDLQLYTVTAVNDESVSLTAIPSANAEMSFLIYNGSDQPKTALLIPTKDEINQAVAPQFKGTLTAQEMPASSATTDYYVLSQNAFVWVKGSGTIPANKCWLEMDKTTNAPAKLRITETTGATGIAGISGLSAPSALYDLQGRKVLHPTLRGIYIQNGKKIVVK